MPIEVRNLSYSYKKGTPFQRKVLNQITLQISQGEFVGLIGPTQSGKTTLAQHFNALLLPQEGQVIINGCDTKSKKADLISLRQTVGYVFQNPDFQLFAPTVGEDIAFGPRNQKLTHTETDHRVREALDQVGLDYDTYYKRDIYALSGGQKRRVAIAGVLACHPEILILDDITAGLDPRGRGEILNLIIDLHRGRKMTIVFISNSMEEVARLAERLIVLNRGQIILDGPTRSVFGEIETMQEIGLELPDVMLLTARLKDKGFNLPPALLTIEEAVDSLDALLTGKKGEI